MNQNKRNYEKFKTLCQDPQVILMFKQMTFFDFYQMVFLQGINPLGHHNEEFNRKVKTFQKQIGEKIATGKQGFDDEVYIDLLRHCAYRNFLEFYN